MPYDIDGFLAPELTGWITQHRDKHASWFALAEKFNRAAHALVERLHIGRDHGQQVLGAALYVRSLEFFQGVLLMAERGMKSPARALLRSQMEATFSLRAITTSVKVMREYIAADIHQRLSVFKKVRANPSAFRAARDEIGDLDIEKAIVELQEEVKGKNVRKVEVRYLAEQGGMEDFYDTAYAIFSGAVHSSARELEDYLEGDEHGTVVSMRWGPRPEDADRLILTAIETLIYGIEAVERTFGLDHGPMAPLIEEFRSLGQTISA